MAAISRRKIAKATTEAIMAGDKRAIQRLAAYLVEQRRVNESELVARDIEQALARDGVVVADVVSARKLSTEAIDSITSFIKNQVKATQVQLRQHIDDSVIGGIRLTYGDKLLDTTVIAKLERLK